ncbi:hypothetical protein BZM26_37085 [Paraburkholderia strydomiana]|nr:hypothetical protein BZM26_37085 [Paraburkholderia strydomiana]
MVDLKRFSTDDDMALFDGRTESPVRSRQDATLRGKNIPKPKVKKLLAETPSVVRSAANANASDEVPVMINAIRSTVSRAFRRVVPAIFITGYRVV